MEATATPRVRLLAGHDVHFLDLVERVAKSAPPVEIKAEEISTDKTIILIPDDNPAIHAGGIVFYKWEGKYVLLLGRETALRALADGKAVLKGKLVSRQALKRCKVEDADPTPTAAQAPVVTPKTYDDEFRNAPRIIDKRATPALLKPVEPEPVKEIQPVQVAAKPYRPRSDSYDTYQRNIRQMGNEAGARVNAPSRPHNASTDLKPSYPKTASPYGERLSEEELVARAKKQHEEDNAAGRVTFAPPDWREQFQAKFGRYPGSLTGTSRPRPRPASTTVARQVNSPVAESGEHRNGSGEIEPGQDRPMTEFGQVDRVVQETHGRSYDPNKVKRSGLYGQNRRSKQPQS